MTVKNEVIKLLEKNGELEGQYLADTLGVSRQAVWNAVNALKNEGYEIIGTSNRGYRLKKTGDVLCAEIIEENAESTVDTISVTVLQSVDSTNTYAKRLAAGGCPSGTVIIANEQTGGRGRRGNSFFSPASTGLYMSVVIRPQEKLVDSGYYTICAANAVCRAIESLTPKKPLIKWVNDVFIDNKKVCGILTEGAADLETRELEYAVIGIGVNVSTDSFPNEIEGIAGAVNEKISRNELAAKIITELYSALCDDYKKSVKYYRERSLVISKTVSFTKNNTSYIGLCLDVLDNGELLVRLENGEEMKLNSGEVSVKL